MVSDQQNNIWFLDFGGQTSAGSMPRAARSRSIRHHTRSRPRRGRLDDLGRIWFAEFAGERVGVFDTRTEQFKEWQVPGPVFRAL